MKLKEGINRFLEGPITLNDILLVVVLAVMSLAFLAYGPTWVVPIPLTAATFILAWKLLHGYGFAGPPQLRRQE